MFKYLKSLCLVALACFSLSGCSLLISPANDTSETSALTVGQAVPDVTFANQAGETVSLKDYAGKTVYINVWASWCGPCKRELPELEEVYQTYKDKDDVVFLSATSPSDDIYGNSNPADKTAKEILAVAKKGKITYPVLFEQKDALSSTFGIRSFPTHIVIKPDGTVSSVTLGSTNAKALTKLIEQAK